MENAVQERAIQGVSPADAIKKLVMAHMRGDKQSFRSVATDFIMKNVEESIILLQMIWNGSSQLRLGRLHPLRR